MIGMFSNKLTATSTNSTTYNQLVLKWRGTLFPVYSGILLLKAVLKVNSKLLKLH